MPGIQSPRVSSNGSDLNSARLISTTIFGGADRPLSTTTLALMQFGQFINHDFESTTQFTFSNYFTSISLNFILIITQQQTDRTSAAVPVPVAR
jgi:hypothetical protein